MNIEGGVLIDLAFIRQRKIVWAIKKKTWYVKNVIRHVKKILRLENTMKVSV